MQIRKEKKNEPAFYPREVKNCCSNILCRMYSVSHILLLLKCKLQRARFLSALLPFISPAPRIVSGTQWVLSGYLLNDRIWKGWSERVKHHQLDVDGKAAKLPFPIPAYL